jgi:hypothetical protein
VGVAWQINSIRHVPTANLSFRNVSGIGTGFYSRFHGNDRVALGYDTLHTYEQPYRLGSIWPQTVSYLDPVATRSADTAYVHLLNRRYESSDTSLVRLDFSDYGETARLATQHTMHILTGFGTPGGSNPFEGAWVESAPVSVVDGVAEIRVPPHSATIVTLALSRSTSAESFGEATGFYLSEAYPNPALGEVRLDLTLPRAARVEIAVFDVLGRSVRRVPAEALGAGAQTLRVPTAGLPSGVYLVRVTAEGERARVATRQLTLVR